MLEALFSMRGKVCVVTGGSTGLGSYMAQGFLEAGAERVYITARSADKLQAKAEELSAIASGECLPVVGDLSTLEGLRHWRPASAIKSLLSMCWSIMQD